MTLVHGFHSMFDQLKVWFVPTVRPTLLWNVDYANMLYDDTCQHEENRYKLEAQTDFFLRSYPEYVTFTTPDPVKLPVPSPTYLAIHAACAKVSHLSGAAECIDYFYRDMDGSATLNPNGASAEMFSWNMPFLNYKYLDTKSPLE
jgi:hypothetical protein